jgi:NADH-quinone oxidoreductase subunit L
MTQETILRLLTIILVLPLLSFVINIFWGKKLGKASSYIGTAILGTDLILAIIVFIGKYFSYPDVNYLQFKFEWFNLGHIKFIVGFGADNVAVVMLLVVTLISTLVHLFSTEYMAGDIRFSRYYAYLGLFTFSMLGIVIANNFLFMYIFWELVGISSYLLIGFWYEKQSAADAGKKAFLTNRIGDFGFFIGIMILYLTYGTTMFDDIFHSMSQGIIPFDSGTILTIAGIGIFAGAIGKSAQWPLHVWLPDAMEGPTPVSALIHAATMVAAGVYLVARAFPIFTADALTFIAIIGTITAFVAATIAVTQLDFKKVLAYSTVSQLGYMVMSLGVGGYTNGFFHLVTHAWFKAALFLASGSVIHAMHHAMVKMNDHHSDPQDINNMGGLRKTMPWTYATFLWVTITISGVPLTSGFLSKDGILGGTLAWADLAGGGWHWLVPLLGFAAAGLTAFYMFRLTIVAFHGKPKTELASHTHENRWPIILPLVVLAFLSFWFIYSPNPIDASAGWFHKSIKQPASVVPAQYQWDFLQIEKHEAPGQIAGHQETAAEHSEGEAHAEHHYLNKFQEVSHHYHMPAMILSLLIAGGGILLAFLIYQFKIFNADKLAEQFKKLHKLSFNKWYFDEIYYSTVIAGTIGLGMVMAWFDNKVIDGMVNLSATITRFLGQATAWFDNVFVDGFVNLTANVTGFFGAILRKTQTGRVQTYLILAVIGLFCIVYFLI